jgi:hypothetical protein
LYDSIDDEPYIDIPVVFHIHQSFNTASELNVIGLYAMLYYFAVYLTVESSTFFCDMYNPVHNECQERSFSYEGNCYCTLNVLEAVCAFRYLNILIVSREQNN